MTNADIAALLDGHDKLVDAFLLATMNPGLDVLDPKPVKAAGAALVAFRMQHAPALFAALREQMREREIEHDGRIAAERAQAAAIESLRKYRNAAEADIRHARDQRDAAIARADGMQKDAERLDWIDANKPAIRFGSPAGVRHYGYWVSGSFARTLRAAIDAAIEARKVPTP